MIYCEKHGVKVTDTTGRCPDCPSVFVRGIENARNHCRKCGWDIGIVQSDINAERDWLCFQCYVDRDAPSQEVLESRF